MPWGAVVGGLIAGGMGMMASDSASSAQTAASNNSIAEQRRQYDLSRQDLAPYRQVGTSALNQLAAMYGLRNSGAITQTGNGGFTLNDNMGTDWGITGSGAFKQRLGPSGGFIVDSNGNPVQGNPAMNGTPKAADYSAFYTSPDYTFARDQGIRATEQSAAARGGAFSGNALRGITDYSSGLASQQFNNYANRLAAMAGIGQSATNTGAQLGAATANNISNNLMQAGDARASGIMGGYNSMAGGINSALNAYTYGRANGYIGGGGSGGGWLYTAPGGSTPTGYYGGNG